MRDLASTLSGAVMPGDEASAFVRSQLNSGEPQLPQYDREFAQSALEKSRALPGAAWLKAAGGYPDADGGYLPGVLEEVKKGDYDAAASDALDIAVGTAGTRLILPRVWPHIKNYILK